MRTNGEMAVKLIGSRKRGLGRLDVLLPIILSLRELVLHYTVVWIRKKERLNCIQHWNLELKSGMDPDVSFFFGNVKFTEISI